MGSQIVCNVNYEREEGVAIGWGRREEFPSTLVIQMERKKWLRNRAVDLNNYLHRTTIFNFLQFSL